jgi:hypothetical protein
MARYATRINLRRRVTKMRNCYRSLAVLTLREDLTQKTPEELIELSQEFDEGTAIIAVHFVKNFIEVDEDQFEVLKDLSLDREGLDYDDEQIALAIINCGSAKDFKKVQTAVLHNEDPISSI